MVLPALRHKLKRSLFWLFCFGMALALANNTAQNGQDFTVFWTAARAILDGGTAYSIERDGFMTFKYPPWVLPFFVPFGLLSLPASKWIWGIIEGASLLYIVRSCLQLGARPIPVVLGLLLYLPIWNVHGFDGQISIVLTAMMLYGRSIFRDASEAPKRVGIAAFVLSAKIFTLFPFLGGRLNRALLRPAMAVTAAAAALTAIAAAIDSSHLSIFQSWLKAAGPGYNSQGVLTISVAGFQSQGLPSLLFRVFDWPGAQMNLVYGCVFGFGLATYLVLKRRYRDDNSDWVWTTWMAATATLQPLAGFHVFVMTFPLAVIAASQNRKVLPWIGIIMISLITEKLGPVGYWLQFLSVKSLGTWLLIASMRPQLALTSADQRT